MTTFGNLEVIFYVNEMHYELYHCLCVQIG